METLVLTLKNMPIFKRIFEQEDEVLGFFELKFVIFALKNALIIHENYS